MPKAKSKRGISKKIKMADKNWSKMGEREMLAKGMREMMGSKKAKGKMMDD